MAIHSESVSTLPKSDEPLVAEGLCSSWPACKLWDLGYLDSKLDCPLKFRLGKRNSQKVQWEPECPSVFASVRQFQDWTSGKEDCANPFSSYALDSWWAYADYIHMTPGSNLECLVDDLKWHQTFGLSDSSATPTFWLGSSGAYSICHYDTYGVNLVLQVFGQKKWTLFPNSDGHNLYATRVPFEESTVFSEVNFPTPNLLKYPLVSNTSPHSVLLNPGDVLFVPRGWWHFVQSTDHSPVTCSVNLWLDEPELDNSYRLREALTQFAAFSLISNGHLKANEVLHANEEELYNSNDWHDLLAENIKNLVVASQTETEYQLAEKKAKLTSPLWHPLSKRTIKECFATSTHIPNNYESNFVEKASGKAILKAFLKTDVIDLVARHLEQGF